MHIVNLILSLIGVGVCWMPFWSFIITIPSLITSTVMFYKHFLGSKKEIKKGRAVVFTSFVISTLAFIASTMMAAVPVALYMVSKTVS